MPRSHIYPGAASNDGTVCPTCISATSADFQTLLLVAAVHRTNGMTQLCPRIIPMLARQGHQASRIRLFLIELPAGYILAGCFVIVLGSDILNLIHYAQVAPAHRKSLNKETYL